MLKKNNLFLTILFISLLLNISIPADNDAPFGDILLHHVMDQNTNITNHLIVQVNL